MVSSVTLFIKIFQLLLQAIILTVCVQAASFINVQFTGEMDNDNISRFRCISSMPPIGCSIEVLINNSTEDFMRFSNNSCNHRNGSCDSDICTCSATCLEFIWSSKRKMMKNQVISCEMRFIVLATGSYKELIASVQYDGKEFFQTNSSTSIYLNKMDNKTNTVDISKALSGELTALEITGVVMAFLALAHIITCGIWCTKRSRKCYCKCRWKKDINSGDVDMRSKSITRSGHTRNKTYERLGGYIPVDTTATESNTVISQRCRTSRGDLQRTIRDSCRTIDTIELCEQCEHMLCDNCNIVYSNERCRTA